MNRLTRLFMVRGSMFSVRKSFLAVVATITIIIAVNYYDVFFKLSVVITKRNTTALLRNVDKVEIDLVNRMSPNYETTTYTFVDKNEIDRITGIVIADMNHPDPLHSSFTRLAALGEMRFYGSGTRSIDITILGDSYLVINNTRFFAKNTKLLIRGEIGGLFHPLVGQTSPTTEDADEQTEPSFSDP